MTHENYTTTQKNLVVIKLGGSIITDKKMVGVIRKATIQRLVTEIVSACKEQDFLPLIIHGAGSVAHPIAAKYNIKNGVYTNTEITIERKFSLIKTHLAMQKLNEIVVAAFEQLHFPVFSFHPSSMGITTDGRLISNEIENNDITFNLAPIQIALNLHIAPILFGDVIFDKKRGFTIISGDQIFAHLVRQFSSHIKYAIYVTNVDGIFTANPTLHPDAKLIPELKVKASASFDEIKERLKNYINFEQSKQDAQTIDVTNGIIGKIQESLAIAKYCPVNIINGEIPNRIYNFLKGKKIVKTTIIADE